MELICPSCRTRYLVPDEAVTEAGRQVSCTECSHEWTAFPQAKATPGMAASAGQSAAGASPAEAQASASHAGQDARGDAASVIHQPDATPDTLSGQAAIADAERAGRHAIPQQIASDPARQQQLAEIRKMLAEVQSGAGGPGASGQRANFLQRQGAARGDGVSNLARDSVPPSPAGQAATAQPAHMPDKEGRDGATAANEGPKETETRPAHPEPEEDYVDPPGFLRTGLLVVVLIVAAMTALYVLQPQITSRLPSTAPALTKYIELIDKLRANLASDYEWIKGKVTGETPSATPPAGEDEEHGTSVENGTGRAPDRDAAASAGSAAHMAGPETGPAAADTPEAGQRPDHTRGDGAGTGAMDHVPAQPGAD